MATNQERLQQNNEKIEAIQQTLINKVVNGGNGTNPELENQIKCFMSGKGSMEIIIPEGITTIRQNAFQIDRTKDDYSVFYSDNLQFPSSLKTIQKLAFLRADIRNKLVIPSTITKVETQAFANINITELEIYSTGLDTYNFTNCLKLVKATFYCYITTIPNYYFDGCTSLREIVLPITLTKLVSGALYNIASLHILKFTGATPPTLNTSSLSNHSTVILLVPYEYYDVYFNASNYQYRGNPIHAYGEFESGAYLPATADGYTIVWYATMDDLEAGTNPITQTTEAGTYYAVYTPVSA